MVSAVFKANGHGDALTYIHGTSRYNVPMAGGQGPLGFESSSGFRYTMEAPIFVRVSDA